MSVRSFGPRRGKGLRRAWSNVQRRWRRWWRVPRIAVVGAPVLVHWSVFAAAAVLAILSLPDLVDAVVFVVCYLIVIGAHECGHALVAHRLGYEVETIRLAAFHGQCEYMAPETEWEDVLIAWGGVAAQVCIAVPVIVLATVFGGLAPPVVVAFFVLLGPLNLAIAAVNLLPFEGFDGATTWRAVPLLVDQWRARRITAKALRAASRRK